VGFARLFGLVALGSSLAACGGAPAPAPAPARTEALAQPPVVARDPYATAGVVGEDPTLALSFRDIDDPELAQPDVPAHRLAREAMKAGRLYEAKRMLGRLANAYPRHDILVAQYDAVVRDIEAAQAEPRASLARAPLHVVRAPPASYTLVRAAPIPDASIPKLTITSQTKHATTDDEEAWFARIGVHLPRYWLPPRRDLLYAPGSLTTRSPGAISDFVTTEQPSSGRFRTDPLPVRLPLAYETKELTSVIDAAPYILAIYANRYLAVYDASWKVVGLFDFAAYEHPPADNATKKVTGRVLFKDSDFTYDKDVINTTHTITLHLEWALAADGVLYVEHRQSDDTKDAKGQAGYLTALDVTTGDMLWRSAPLVASARTFALARGAVVCGYGSTTFVLDRATGKTMQTLPVATSPQYIVWDAGVLHVRGEGADVAIDAK
jgi:hypothetical protein